ncbi:hypothetical protein ACFY4C_40110 [Actinomadura viridis]|uniref:hypothetical protein n=1 Tax=Actinomadura viridis TaxID=58110 RepID=UPI0036D1F49E
MTDVNIIRCTEPAELYRRYDGQGAAQPAFIELDLSEGTLLADYKAEVGNAVPMAVFHGLRRRYPIPVLIGEAANRVMEELAPLAQRVLDDCEEVWNGHNMVARLGEDAQAAEEEIAARLGLDRKDAAMDGRGFEAADLVAEWDVDGAVNGEEAAEYGIVADTSDERLEEIAVDIIAQLAEGDPSPVVPEMAEGSPSPVVVVPGLGEYLRQLREGARQDA